MLKRDRQPLISTMHLITQFNDADDIKTSSGYQLDRHMSTEESTTRLFDSIKTKSPIGGVIVLLAADTWDVAVMSHR